MLGLFFFAPWCHKIGLVIFVDVFLPIGAVKSVWLFFFFFFCPLVPCVRSGCLLLFCPLVPCVRFCCLLLIFFLPLGASLNLKTIHYLNIRNFKYLNFNSSEFPKFIFLFSPMIGTFPPPKRIIA